MSVDNTLLESRTSRKPLESIRSNFRVKFKEQLEQNLAADFSSIGITGCASPLPGNPGRAKVFAAFEAFSFTKALCQRLIDLVSYFC